MNEVDAAKLLEKAHAHLIRFHALEDHPPILSRGQNAKVWDVEGNEYIDFVSGQICATIGHNHPRIIEALQHSCGKMIHSNNYMLHDDSIVLAEKLAELLPSSLDKLIFKSTGSEANEAAMAMAKVHTGGYEIVAPQRGFFGTTSSCRSATYSYGHQGHGPGLPGNISIPAPYAYRCPIRHCNGACDTTCLDVGFDLYDAQTEGYGAAVIVEPIFSAGGLLDPPERWFTRLAEKTRERGMLLILDESQTAPARLGVMFGFQELGVVPDMLTFSKCIGGGIPLSVVVTSREIEESCFEKHFIMGSSHTNDPLPCRVGLAVLEVLIEEDLSRRAKELGDYLRSRLDALAQKYEIIGDVRGRGLLQGMELVQDRNSKEPAEAEGFMFSEACLERGLIANIVRMKGQNSVIRMAPPLTIPRDELDRGIEIMDEAFRMVSDARARQKF
jgi:2,2-dialkylglycine decarboxylase (pyruvate)